MKRDDYILSRFPRPRFPRLVRTVIAVHFALVIIAVAFSLITRFIGLKIIPSDLNSLLGGGMLAISPIVLVVAISAQHQEGRRLPIVAYIWLAIANGVLGYVVYCFIRDGIGM